MRGSESTDRASLAVGDRVRMSGGYDMEPEWLSGAAGQEGVVVAFIPGQNESPAAVLELDAWISTPKASGRIVVLELRHVGQGWDAEGTVHIELCGFMPEQKRWQDRPQGVWVESHARYQRID